MNIKLESPTSWFAWSVTSLLSWVDVGATSNGYERFQGVHKLPGPLKTHFVGRKGSWAALSKPHLLLAFATGLIIWRINWRCEVTRGIHSDGVVAAGLVVWRINSFGFVQQIVFSI
jgi:hypothetical protein